MRSVVPGTEDGKSNMKAKAALIAVVVIGAALYFGLRTTPSSGKPNTKQKDDAVETEEPSPEVLGQSRKAADPVVATPAKAGKGNTLFTAAWGSKDDQLGRERPQEGNPIGPMSFDVDGKGRVHVLDGVNGRLVTRNADGKTESTTVLDAPYPEDIAVADDGSTAVLDRHRDKSISLYDENGKRVGKLPLEGENVPDTGSVTGVFVDGKDVYVEKEHGPLVKLGTMGGIPASPRNEIPGRPTRDGLSFINAGIIEAPAGRVYVSSIDRQTNQHRFTRELKLQAFVHSLVLLDTDKSGTIYFGADVEAGSSSQVLLYCLDPQSGAPTGSAVLPSNTLPEESFRDYTVLDDGGVIQALRTEQGVSYTRYDCM
jgi:hypothetical protein